MIPAPAGKASVGGRQHDLAAGMLALQDAVGLGCPGEGKLMADDRAQGSTASSAAMARVRRPSSATSTP